MPRIIEHPEVATLADTDKLLADTPGGGTHSISVGNLKKIFGEDEGDKPIPPATEIDWTALTNFADTAGLLPSDMMLLAGVIAASDIETQSLNYEILWKDVQTRLLGKNSGYILDSGENIQANTMAGRIAGALGAKQLYSTLLDKLGGNTLTYNESEDAYYIQHGADAVPKKLGNGQGNFEFPDELSISLGVGSNPSGQLQSYDYGIISLPTFGYHYYKVSGTTNIAETDISNNTSVEIEVTGKYQGQYAPSTITFYNTSVSL